MNPIQGLAAGIAATLLIAAGTAWTKPRTDGGGSARSWAEPMLSFSSDRFELAAGETALLSWASANTRSCEASGAWSGRQATDGVFRTPPLTATSMFILTCSSKGTSVEQTLTLKVAQPAPAPEPMPEPTPEPTPEPAPAPAPTLSFSASHDRVAAGGTVTLQWSASHADGCTASGGWAGDRPVSGSATVGPLGAGTTFTLSCTGDGGNVLQMLTVQLVSQVTINWVPPTQNVDGSPLTSLAGYRVYVGQFSRQYTEVLPVSNAAATQHSLALPSGSYFVTMTAVDASGNESAYANEIVRTAP